MTGSTTPPKPDVPKGPATITGYTAAATMLITALLAYVFKDGDEQTLGVISSGVVGLASLLWTNYGRQKQAVEQIRQVGAVQFAVADQARSQADRAEPYMEDEILPFATTGEDPEYDTRDGTLETRLRLEQREGCE